MATVTVNAGTEGGFINNISGIYPASSEGFYISSTSSSSDTNMNEAHIWFNTLDANTGLTPADTVTKVELTIEITAYSNPNPSVDWRFYYGTGAGATFDIADFGVDGAGGNSYGPISVPPLSGTGAFTGTIATTVIRDANYHIRIQAFSDGMTPTPSGSITFSYTTIPYLTLTYTPGSSRKPPQMTLMGVGM